MMDTSRACLRAAAVLAAVGLAAAACGASAQTGPAPAGVGVYGSLGYSNLDSTRSPDTDLSALTGRIGARFGRYLGVEGEASTGLGSGSASGPGVSTSSHLNNQYAGYVVGFLPVAPRIDLLARVGYGGQAYRVTDRIAGASYDNHYDTLNYGAGAQYAFDPKDAVRFDYTRYDSQRSYEPDSNTFSLSFVRRF